MAVEELLYRDQTLFRLGANERTITHRFGIYLDRFFLGWDVDCEYNRTGHQPKRVITDNDPKLVFPDVIIHRRDTQDNLLAIEVKISPTLTGAAADKEELRSFKHELGYIHALFLSFSVLPDGQIKVEQEWIVD